MASQQNTIRLLSNDRRPIIIPPITSGGTLIFRHIRPPNSNNNEDEDEEDDDQDGDDNMDDDGHGEDGSDNDRFDGSDNNNNNNNNNNNSNAWAAFGVNPPYVEHFNDIGIKLNELNKTNTDLKCKLEEYSKSINHTNDMKYDKILNELKDIRNQLNNNNNNIFEMNDNTNLNKLKTIINERYNMYKYHIKYGSFDSKLNTNNNKLHRLSINECINECDSICNTQLNKMRNMKYKSHKQYKNESKNCNKSSINKCNESKTLKRKRGNAQCDERYNKISKLNNNIKSKKQLQNKNTMTTADWNLYEKHIQIEKLFRDEGMEQQLNKLKDKGEEMIKTVKIGRIPKRTTKKYLDCNHLVSAASTNKNKGKSLKCKTCGKMFDNMLQHIKNELRNYIGKRRSGKTISKDGRGYEKFIDEDGKTRIKCVLNKECDYTSKEITATRNMAKLVNSFYKHKKTCKKK